MATHAEKTTVRDDVAAFKRKQILDAAVDLFHRNGFHGTSVDAIAGTLGVSKQFVYYQFRDKAAILNGVCTAGAELTLSAIVDSEEGEGAPTEQMGRFCRRLTEIVIDHGNYLAIYASEVSTLRDEDRRRISGIRAEVDDRVSHVVARGQRSGDFIASDPLIAARAVTGMISFMWTWAHPTTGAERDLLIEQMVQIALRSLGVVLPAQQR
jgi:AcrR family transcriptional regulator